MQCICKHLHNQTKNQPNYDKQKLYNKFMLYIWYYIFKNLEILQAQI